MSKDPYVYDDTNVLKNLANIKEQHKLDDYETTMVNLGIIKLLKSDIEAARHSLKSISLHKWRLIFLFM